MSFWDNEGFWAATGGGLQGALRVGGSNASVADWLAAFGAGSGIAVDQRQQELEQARLLEERRQREEEDRAYQMEQRRLQQQQQQELAATRLREQAFNQERDARAMAATDPNFVGPQNPNPIAPDAYPTPGGYADDAAARAQAEQKRTADETKRRMIAEVGTRLGIPLTGDLSLDEPTVKAALTAKAKQAVAPAGAGGLTPAQSLAQQKFDYQQEKDKRAQEANATKGAQAVVDKWRSAYQKNLELAGELNVGEPPEKIAEAARALTESVYGQEPPDPRQVLVSGQNGAGKPKPALTPGFSGSLPTAQSKTATPTGTTAPPKVAATPTMKKLEAVDTSLNQALPGMPPEVRAKVKARVMMLMHKNGMTLEQVMQALMTEAAQTPFGAPPQ